MPTVALENVSKSYAPHSVAVRDVTLDVADGELLTLVGPSGCGKTTLLRLIAGLEQPTAGTIRIGGQVVDNVPPAERGVGMVFQRPALYPHRTVRDNLGFALKLQQGGWWRRFTAVGRVKNAARLERVGATASMLGLESVLDRYPSQLSGGQQQRVALGRVLVRQPGVILLDEPLSNLDAGLRHELRRELHLLQRQLNATMVCVTHDPAEALSLGDRIAVLDNGRLQQLDRAEVLLRQPVNRFVAGFVGWPPLNFVDGEIQARREGLVFACCAWRWPVPTERVSAWGPLAQRPVTVGIRPKNVQLQFGDSVDGLPMRVRLVEPHGTGSLITLKGQQLEITAWLAEGCQNPMQMDIMAKGKNVMVQIQLESALLFDRISGLALAVAESG